VHNTCQPNTKLLSNRFAMLCNVSSLSNQVITSFIITLRILLNVAVVSMVVSMLCGWEGSHVFMRTVCAVLKYI
jgi:hypothetical protein